ncbi:MAG: hypothetical protein AAGG09_22305, partial [Pseudomonadota bacterium]
PPAMDGDTLVFYARKAFLGLPYKVEVPPGGEPVYLPIALAQEQAPEGEAPETPVAPPPAEESTLD